MILFLSVGYAKSQTVINGSFESTSAGMSCQYNLANGTFNSMMSNVNAFGPGNECDILINGCYNWGIPDGVRAVGLAASPSDAIALALSAPLVTGTSYTLSFWSYSEVSFRPQGNLEIGTSTSNAAFGTLIYTATTVPSTWINHTVTFIAPNNATHLTVRNVAGAIHWNHVDNFVFSNPLPVELLSFSAKPINGNLVELNWETATETNNDYFTVERSQDGQNWEETGRTSGAGNSTSINAYQDFDQKPYSSLSYYRLKQTDFDGAYSYSAIVAVELSSLENHKLSVYPNPALNSITLEGVTSELAEITLLNIMGQDVGSDVKFNRISDSMLSIDLSGLASGIYFVQGKTELIKLIKK